MIPFRVYNTGGMKTRSPAGPQITKGKIGRIISCEAIPSASLKKRQSPGKKPRNQRNFMEGRRRQKWNAAMPRKGSVARFWPWIDFLVSKPSCSGGFPLIGPVKNPAVLKARTDYNNQEVEE